MRNKFPSKIAQEFGEYWQNNPHRHFLWLPVCLGAGMGIYFALPHEPAWGLALAVLMIPAGWKLSVARYAKYHLLFAALSLMAIGFVWAKIHTERTHQVMLEKEQSISNIQGRILELSDTEKGYRILLDEVKVEGLPAKRTPTRIRIKYRAKDMNAMTGDYIALRAGLLPPSGPVMPDGFDFARYFYFQGIGAVGYGLPSLEVIRNDDAPQWQTSLTRLRERLSAHIRSDMTADAGGVAAALMTGDRAVVTKHAAEVMRATNLSHVLAIFGMHMAIVCGLTYMAIRRLLVLLPFTRYLPFTKKLAALAALGIGAGYLLLAGIPLSAARAYVMVGMRADHQ